MPPKKTIGSLVGIRGEREIYQLAPPSWSIGTHDQDYGVDFELEVWTEDEEPEFFARNVALQVKSRGTFGNLDFDDYEKYESAALPNISHCPKTRIKKSTLEYLARSNSFLFHICHDYDYRRLPHFQQFFDLFEADARQVMIITNRNMFSNNAPLVSVIPLRPVFEITKDHDRQSISIPLIPQFYHSLPAIEWDRKRNKPNKIHKRDPYKLPDYIDFDNMLFLNSWKECITLGIRSHTFLEMTKISFWGHLDRSASEHLEAALSKYDAAWFVVEALVSAYASARNRDGFKWIENHIASDSAFINFLAMRCCRKHQVRLIEPFLNYCRSGFPYGTTTLCSDPYDAKRGKYFLSRFYNEAVYYFVDLLKFDVSGAKKLLHTMIDSDEYTKRSLGYFFGSFERHKKMEKELLIFFLSEIQGSSPAPDEKKKKLRNDLIRHLNAAGIQWSLLGG